MHPMRSNLNLPQDQTQAKTGEKKERSSPSRPFYSFSFPSKPKTDCTLARPPLGKQAPEASSLDTLTLRIEFVLTGVPFRHPVPTEGTDEGKRAVKIKQSSFKRKL